MERQHVRIGERKKCLNINPETLLSQETERGLLMAVVWKILLLPIPLFYVPLGKHFIGYWDGVVNFINMQYAAAPGFMVNGFDSAG